MKNILKVGIVGLIAYAPLLAFAEDKTLRDVIVIVIGYFEVFVTLIIGLAFLTFVWNIYNYFFKADVENKKEAGLYVLWSAVGFFVIISIWGLVNILTNSIKLNTNQPVWPFAGSNLQQTGGGQTTSPNLFLQQTGGGQTTGPANNGTRGPVF